MPARKPIILVVSRDFALADVRKTVLENAGLEVIPATDVTAVREACEKHKISLVMIGYSLPPAEKRRVWSTVREVGKTPILELVHGGKPEIVESAALLVVHESLDAEDFLKTVQAIVRKQRRRTQ